jgi:hypothetical protein
LLFRVGTRHLPRGDGDVSHGNVFVWAKDEAEARRNAAAHMRRCEVHAVEKIGEWRRSSDALGKPGDRASSSSSYEPSATFRLPPGRKGVG